MFYKTIVWLAIGGGILTMNAYPRDIPNPTNKQTIAGEVREPSGNKVQVVEKNKILYAGNDWISIVYNLKTGYWTISNKDKSVHFRNLRSQCRTGEEMLTSTDARKC
jgi:hypothetical protein